MKQEYLKNGYYVAKNLLNLEAINAALDDVNKIFVQQLIDKNLVVGKTLHENMKTLFDYDVALYLASARIAKRLLSIEKLFQNEKIYSIIKNLGLDLITVLQGPILHISAPNLKIPGGYDGIEMHQDFTSLQSSLDAVIVWLPLTELDAKTISLEFIPGSHLDGILKGEITNYAYEVDLEAVDTSKMQRLEISQGDVLFFSCFLAHRTEKNPNAEKLRLGASIRFENAAEKTFIKRNYPYTMKETVNREILFPNFPSKEEVRKVFNG
jgi:ectoine hydroxylase-related dioxygenase (phytanoyl-CoA dioxygenase family)